MDSISVAQTTEHRAICPTCGAPAIRETTWETGIITITATSVYSDAAGHMWQTQWIARVDA